MYKVVRARTISSLSLCCHSCALEKLQSVLETIGEPERIEFGHLFIRDGKADWVWPDDMSDDDVL